MFLCTEAAVVQATAQHLRGVGQVCGLIVLGQQQFTQFAQTSDIFFGFVSLGEKCRVLVRLLTEQIIDGCDQFVNGFDVAAQSVNRARAGARNVRVCFLEVRDECVNFFNNCLGVSTVGDQLPPQSRDPWPFASDA